MIRFAKRDGILMAALLALLGAILLLAPAGLSQTPRSTFSSFGTRFGGPRPTTRAIDRRPQYRDLGALEEAVDPTTLAAPYAVVEGTVVDESGKPAAGILVMIAAKGSSHSYKVPTDKNGTYSCSGLQTGDYILAVEYMGRIGLAREVPLRNGHRFASDFDLKYFDGVSNAGTSFAELIRILNGQADPVDAGFVPPNALREAYAKAKEAASRGDYETAAALLRELVAKAPGEVVFWRHLGESYLQLSDYKNAASSFRKAMELNPRAAEYPGLLALSLLFVGDMDEAERFTRITADIDRSAGAEAYYNLGLALTDGGEGLRAESAFRKAIELNENHPGALFQLGLTLLSTHPDLRDAKVPLERFLSMTPDGEDAVTARLLLDEISNWRPLR